MTAVNARFYLLFCFICFCQLSVWSIEQVDSFRTDTVKWMRSVRHSTAVEGISATYKKRKYKFNEIDTTYIEPQHYNFTVMLQNTNSYELYQITSKNGQRISFAPETTFKVGPYFGWRWVFLGYTFDVRHLNFKTNKSQRQEYDFSIYSSMVGVDLYYRKTGSDYLIRDISTKQNINTSPMEGQAFNGLQSNIKGFNIYYIFNHRRFSYPAAFSQSTVQRRSVGSVLLGIGYTKHTLSVDWASLNHLMEEHLGKDITKSIIDSTLTFGKIKYKNFSITGGYAYNWVFARNWLLSGSIAIGAAYKQQIGEVERKRFSFREFSFKNINFDATYRLGLVWNNTRWYAGASSIFHAYNYRQDHFSTNNFFGNINLYVGFNFDKKAKQRKKKKKQ